MKCGRCQFENIPGQERCIRCHSLLVAPTAVLTVDPPRMPAWRGPFRSLARRMRGLRVLPERFWAGSGDGGRGIHLGSDPLVTLVLSLVPGLGHLVRRRFREVALWTLAWLVLVSAAVFCWGSQIGFVLLGLGIGVHAWIAVRAGLWQTLKEPADRLVAVLGVLIVLAFLYAVAPRVLFFGYRGIQAPTTIPGLRIRAGDYLLVRRGAGASVPLARGTLVLVHPPSMINGVRLNHPFAVTLGQIVGLPSEMVAIQDDAYVVEGQRLDPQSFPVPAWLRGRAYGTQVPPDSYFISVEYQFRGNAHRGLTNVMITDVSTIKTDAVQGRVFLRWWPPSRRGFLE